MNLLQRMQKQLRKNEEEATPPPGERHERHLIIGMGEIGTALYQVLNRHVIVFARDKHDLGHQDIDVLHIAIPYSADFTQQVSYYREIYAPKLTMVYSSTPIGTCASIGSDVVHSPIEGKHPNLTESIMSFPRWIAAADEKAIEYAAQVWIPIVGVVRSLGKADWSEWLKIRSTSKFGAALVWADYEKQVCVDLKLDYKAVQDFDLDYNLLYKMIGMPQFSRYVLDPPNGEIGGHCVTQNAELLDKQYPHPILKMIKRMRIKGGKK